MNEKRTIYLSDLVVIGTFLVVILALVIIMVKSITTFKTEREEWYRSHYYISQKIEEKMVSNREDRKKIYQLRVIGILKEANKGYTDDELIEYTSLIFDKSEEYDWDPYIPIAVAWVESSYERTKIGRSDDRGLYQFLPSTAKYVSLLAKIDYYNGIEFNLIDSTKLWFAYMKILNERFENDWNYALLSYNAGERRVILSSSLKLNKETGLFDFSSGNLTSARKEIYYNNGFDEAYDEKVIRYLKIIKERGINNNDESLLKAFEKKEKEK